MTTAPRDRTPPHDLEAELGLLKGVMVDPSTMDIAARIVSGADFHCQANGNLFAGLQALHEAGKLVRDPLVTVPALREIGVTAQQWDNVALYRMLAGEGVASHVGKYAETIANLSALRRQQDLVTVWGDRIDEPGANAIELAGWAESQMSAMLAGVENSQAQPIGEALEDVFDDLDNPQAKPTVDTGLAPIDTTVCGLCPGELIVIAARPGNGKTSLGTQIASHNAQQGRNVLFVSLEMSAKELATRVCCGMAGVDSRLVRSRNLQPADRQAMVEAYGRLHDIPLHIWSPPTASVAQIRGMARWEKRRRGLSLVVVDYIQLLHPADRTENREQQVASFSRGLKALARDVEVPVIVMAQLNRQMEAGATPRKPRLSDLRESGAIEQDADGVWFIHHAGKNEPVCFIVAKCRNGATGEIPLRFLPQETRFAQWQNETLAEWSKQS